MNNAIPLDRSRPLFARFFSRLGCYWSMTKDLQTGLLALTAAAGYVSGCCLNPHGGTLSALVGSIFLAVSGSTVLNMFFDRDIDAMMERTAKRPLPMGKVREGEALALGLILTLTGLGWAFYIFPLYGAAVTAGVAFDVLVYTIWLKRRTPFAIIIGGLAGGMPVLAGRVLAVGTVDLPGILLALTVLLWIPTHIMTFSIKIKEDYARAGIPTFPSTYGVAFTRKVIAVSTILAVGVLELTGWMIGLPSAYLLFLGLLGAALSILVAASLAVDDHRLDHILYKGASVYMLAAMLTLIWCGL